ncbi:PH domain-containing protein [Plasmodiophora brassicae]|nr:hypothetical protein PBRA_003601 [Plasmodiophora brassicae]
MTFAPAGVAAPSRSLARSEATHISNLETLHKLLVEQRDPHLECTAACASLIDVHRRFLSQLQCSPTLTTPLFNLAMQMRLVVDFTVQAWIDGAHRRSPALAALVRVPRDRLRVYLARLRDEVRSDLVQEAIGIIEEFQHEIDRAAHDFTMGGAGRRLAGRREFDGQKVIRFGRLTKFCRKGPGLYWFILSGNTLAYTKLSRLGLACGRLRQLAIDISFDAFEVPHLEGDRYYRLQILSAQKSFEIGSFTDQARRMWLASLRPLINSAHAQGGRPAPRPIMKAFASATHCGECSTRFRRRICRQVLRPWRRRRHCDQCGTLVCHGCARRLDSTTYCHTCLFEKDIRASMAPMYPARTDTSGRGSQRQDQSATNADQDVGQLDGDDENSVYHDAPEGGAQPDAVVGPTAMLPGERSPMLTRSTVIACPGEELSHSSVPVVSGSVSLSTQVPAPTQSATCDSASTVCSDSSPMLDSSKSASSDDYATACTGSSTLLETIKPASFNNDEGANGASSTGSRSFETKERVVEGPGTPASDGTGRTVSLSRSVARTGDIVKAAMESVCNGSKGRARQPTAGESDRSACDTFVANRFKPDLCANCYQRHGPTP